MAGRIPYLASNSPAVDAFDITPDDNNDLSQMTRRIYVGGAGNLRVTTREDTDIVIKNIQAGTVLDLVVKKVWSTNTTATDIVGLI